MLNKSTTAIAAAISLAVFTSIFAQGMNLMGKLMWLTVIFGALAALTSITQRGIPMLVSLLGGIVAAASALSFLYAPLGTINLPGAAGLAIGGILLLIVAPLLPDRPRFKKQPEKPAEQAILTETPRPR